MWVTSDADQMTTDKKISAHIVYTQSNAHIGPPIMAYTHNNSNNKNENKNSCTQIYVCVYVYDRIVNIADTVCKRKPKILRMEFE